MTLNWGTFQTGDWLIGLVSTLVAYFLFTFLQRLLNRNHFLGIIAFQLNLLVLVLLALLFLTPQPSTFSFLINSGVGGIRRRCPLSSGISAAGRCRWLYWWS
jgi:uncharacterized membrane protein YjjP (DUF1212 family)